MRHRLLIALPLLAALPATAEIRLPHILSDHAVLQRDAPVRIWGWAEPRETVTVRFHAQTVSAQADEIGDWEVWLAPESAGGPFTLAVTGDVSKGSVGLGDILVGDVWLASGQSNMELPLEGFAHQPPPNDSAREIAAANRAEIRLLLQGKGTSTVPLDDIAQTWTECTPATAAHFSAVAYFFGREIAEREHVPVGVIDASWGGTPAHSWISPAALAAANLSSVFRDAGTIAVDQARANRIRAAQDREDAELRAAGKPTPAHPSIPGDHEGSWVPGGLFNAMIAPDTRFAIKGAIWYQGETDSDPQRSPYYRRVFSTLISDWRGQWGEGDFPFLFVQISSYNASGGWAEVRDAQRRTLALRNTAMAVTLDVGDPTNVHPTDKATVGHRLALAARATVYGERIESNSPTFVQATTEPNAVRVWFDHAEGLTARGPDAGQPTLGGFELAGEDRKFHPAAATVERIGERETVLVSSPAVPAPRFVRYGWSGNVTTYLYNGAGLPAGTFTSESIP